MSQQVRVLIADDQPKTCQSLKVLLGTWPEVVVVCQAANGWEAVQQVEVCQPDVVLLDVRMPVMDGLEATRLIKNKWPGVRVIVLTMYLTHRDEALAAGADAFVLKGDSADELLAAILNAGEPHGAEPV